MNYCRELPKTKNEMDVPGSPPAFTSWQSQVGNPTASSVLSLTDKTTFLEISVITGASGNGGLLAKWGVSSVTSTNFDFFVNSGVTRQVAVPVSVFGTSSIAGANVANGLYNSISFKNANAQASSVFTTEY